MYSSIHRQHIKASLSIELSIVISYKVWIQVRDRLGEDMDGEVVGGRCIVRLLPPMCLCTELLMLLGCLSYLDKLQR